MHLSPEEISFIETSVRNYCRSYLSNQRKSGKVLGRIVEVLMILLVIMGMLIRILQLQWNKPTYYLLILVGVIVLVVVRRMIIPIEEIEKHVTCSIEFDRHREELAQALFSPAEYSMIMQIAQALHTKNIRLLRKLIRSLDDWNSLCKLTLIQELSVI